jgi:thymidylate synthase
VSKLVSGDNCNDAWLSAVKHILDCGGDCFNVVVEIKDPVSEDIEMRRLLDSFLQTAGKKPIDEVANTIFPSSLYFPSLGRKQLYENYEIAWPLIKLFNRWGTYFYRMIHWGEGEKPINQLENTLRKLRDTISGKPKYRSIYEISIYQPHSDQWIRMGAPCLSHLSFKLENGALFLTVLYRNHFYIERAYGNFIGLGRLMEFMARESKISVGQLTCISTHAELGNVSKSSVGSLVSSCSKCLKIDTDQ